MPYLEAVKIKNLHSECSYAKDTLQEVSRTFAINISCLKGELYWSVLLGYLFCRIIDTVEDAENLSPQIKKEALLYWGENFPFRSNRNSQLKHFHEIIQKEAESPETKNSKEELLFKKTSIILELFDCLDKDYQEGMIKPIQTMANGMAKFQDFRIQNDFAWIPDIPTLEEYCYYVAGTVGELLTALFLVHSKGVSEKNKKIIEENAISFGIGLQITNILKDILDDQDRDWCYLPKTLLEENGLTPQTFFDPKNGSSSQKVLQQLIDHTAQHLDDALKYTEAWKVKQIRLFCYLPLHFAIQTLCKISSSPLKTGEYQNKISRNEVKKTIGFTKMFSFCNLSQKLFYFHYRKRISR